MVSLNVNLQNIIFKKINRLVSKNISSYGKVSMRKSGDILLNIKLKSIFITPPNSWHTFYGTREQKHDENSQRKHSIINGVEKLLSEITFKERDYKFDLTSICVYACLPEKIVHTFNIFLKVDRELEFRFSLYAHVRTLIYVKLQRLHLRIKYVISGLVSKINMNNIFDCFRGEKIRNQEKKYAMCRLLLHKLQNH